MANYLTTDSELGAVADAIRARGGTTAALEYPDGFVAAINAIPSGPPEEPPENDVNFFDYDGTLLYSYTLAEFAALTDWPDNPSHDGLVAQGWGWSNLANAQDHAAYAGFADFGQAYITDDECTRLHITLDDPAYLAPILKLYVATGSTPATVDFGDGDVTTISQTGNVTVTHVYRAPGDYIISLSKGVRLGYYGGSSSLLNGSLFGNGQIYRNSLRKVNFGKSSGIASYSLGYCVNLESVSWPSSYSPLAGTYGMQGCVSLRFLALSNVYLNSNYMLDGCSSLRNLTFSDTVTFVNSASGNTYMLRNCNNLRRVAAPKLAVVPNGFTQACLSLRKFSGGSATAPLTQLGSYAFGACYSLKQAPAPKQASLLSSCYNNMWSLEALTIPDTVTSIAASAVSNAYSLQRLRFEGATPPTVANANAFSGLPATCIISVPVGSLAAYTSAANYPSATTYTYVEEA